MCMCVCGGVSVKRGNLRVLQSQFQFHFESSTQPIRAWVTWLPTSSVSHPHPSWQLHASQSGFCLVNRPTSFQVQDQILSPACASFYLDVTVPSAGSPPLFPGQQTPSHIYLCTLSTHTSPGVCGTRTTGGFLAEME